MLLEHDKESLEIFEKNKRIGNHIQEGCKQLPLMDFVQPFHGVIVMQTMQKTHVTANQQVDTHSYSQVVPFRGNLRSRLQSLCLQQKRNTMPWVLHVKMPFGSNR